MSTTKVRIFDNEAAELLGVLFKRDRSAETFAQLCELAHNLLQSILQSEKYPNPEDIYHFLYQQIERWVERWVPGRGHLYAYLSAATKNAAVSFVSKEALYRSKIVGTDVSLEEIAGGGDPYQVIRSEDLARLREGLLNTEVRWHEPEIRGAIRYCFLLILEGNCRTIPDRTKAIRYLMAVTVQRSNGTSYTLSQKQAKILLAYAQGVVRTLFLNVKIGDQNLTEGDLFRLRFEFSPFVDIEEIVGPAAAKLLLTHFAGQTVKFPTLKVQGEVKRQIAAFNTMITDDEQPLIPTPRPILHDDIDSDDDDVNLRHDASRVGREMVKLGSFPLFDDGGLVDEVFRGYGEGE